MLINSSLSYVLSIPYFISNIVVQKLADGTECLICLASKSVHSVVMFMRCNTMKSRYHEMALHYRHNDYTTFTRQIDQLNPISSDKERQLDPTMFYPYFPRFSDCLPTEHSSLPITMMGLHSTPGFQSMTGTKFRPPVRVAEHQTMARYFSKSPRGRSLHLPMSRKSQSGETMSCSFHHIHLRAKRNKP